MDLALALGRTLEELGESMSAAEFSMWIARNAKAPIGARRGDLQAGVIAATIANYAGRMRGKDAPPATPLDFMPLEQRPEPIEEDSDPLAFFRGL